MREMERQGIVLTLLCINDKKLNLATHKIQLSLSSLDLNDSFNLNGNAQR